MVADCKDAAEVSAAWLGVSVGSVVADSERLVVVYKQIEDLPIRMAVLSLLKGVSTSLREIQVGRASVLRIHTPDGVVAVSLLVKRSMSGGIQRQVSSQTNFLPHHY